MVAVNYGQQVPQQQQPLDTGNNNPFGAEALRAAYKADPRSQFYNGLMQAGSSTAPVATHGYGFADGIARALTGMAGAYGQKKMMDNYAKQAEGLVNGQQQAGMQGIVNGMQGENMASLAATLNPNAAKVGMGMPLPQRQLDPAQAQQGVAFTDPLAGKGRVTSGFGQRTAPMAGASTNHRGIDIAAPAGTPVVAVAAGTVTEAGSDPKNGNYVTIRHPDGTSSKYAHMSTVGVRMGSQVQEGQPIGGVGNSGTATGNNLHFGMIDQNGNRIDPSRVIRGTSQSTTNSQSASRRESGSVTTTTPNGPVPSADGFKVDVPDLPEAMPRPSAPKPTAAPRSMTLDEAYRSMLRGNILEYDRNNAMLEKGMAEQYAAEREAAARAQEAAMAEYHTDAQAYNSSLNSRMQAGIADRAAAVNNNYDVGRMQYGGQIAQANAKTTQQYAWANDEHKAQLDRRAAQEKATYDLNTQLKVLEAKGEMKRTSLSEPEKKEIRSWNSETQNYHVMNSDLDRYEQLLKKVPTGTLASALVPRVASYHNDELTEMAAIQSRLVRGMSKELRGSISNTDLDFLQRGFANAANSRFANQQIINRIRQINMRNIDYRNARSQAYVTGGIGGDNAFHQKWGEYLAKVPDAGYGPTFQEWLNMPKEK